MEYTGWRQKLYHLLHPKKTDSWTSTPQIFTVDYAAHCLVAKNWKSMFTGFKFIDLLSFIPFYVEVIVVSLTRDGITSMDSFLSILFSPDQSSIIWGFRILRLCRLVKILSLSSSLRLVAKALKGSLTGILVLIVMFPMMVVFFSTIVFFAERSGCIYDTNTLSWYYTLENGGKKSPFQSIADCFWLTIVTLTTVGYGDQVPVTIPGKLAVSVVLMASLFIVAFPLTMITLQYTKVVRMFKQKQRRRKQDQFMIGRDRGSLYNGRNRSMDLNDRDIEDGSLFNPSVLDKDDDVVESLNMRSPIPPHENINRNSQDNEEVNIEERTLPVNWLNHKMVEDPLDISYYESQGTVRSLDNGWTVRDTITPQASQLVGTSSTPIQIPGVAGTLPPLSSYSQSPPKSYRMSSLRPQPIQPVDFKSQSSLKSAPKAFAGQKIFSSASNLVLQPKTATSSFRNTLNSINGHIRAESSNDINNNTIRPKKKLCGSNSGLISQSLPLTQRKSPPQQPFVIHSKTQELLVNRNGVVVAGRATNAYGVDPFEMEREVDEGFDGAPELVEIGIVDWKGNVVEEKLTMRIKIDDDKKYRRLVIFLASLQS